MKEQQKIYDVIVIGGGPAGSTISTFLAREGHAVLLLEKEKFPRPHVGESLLPFCYSIFEDLGVLEEMNKRFVRKPGVTFSNVDGSEFSNWCFSQVIDGPEYLSYHVIRADFDDMLLRNSEKNGVAVWEESQVGEIDLGKTGGDASVAVKLKDGETITLKTRFVIDASGASTLLARQMGTRQPNTRLNPRVAYATHWKGINYDEDLRKGNLKIVHLEGEKLGWIWVTPVGDDRVSIGLALNMSYAKAQRRELAPNNKDWQMELYLQELNSSPMLSEYIRGAKVTQELAVVSDFSFASTQKYGENFAIIGDAAAFLDPLFASGIYLGMKAGQDVANAVSELLKGGGNEALKRSYSNIEGAYDLVEDMISTFYRPDSIRFSSVGGTLPEGFEKSESAFSIIHLLLAGDFFTEHKKYRKAVELLSDRSMVEKYCNLIKHPIIKEMNVVCRTRNSKELAAT